MTRARLSRRDGYERFVAEHGDQLVGLAFLMCGDRGRAEDATQEALAQLYRRWRRIDDPLPYARRAVLNATREQWRVHSRRARAEQALADLPPEGRDTPQEQFVWRERVHEALADLPRGQRTVIVLRYWHQLSEAETATTLGISIGTVKSQTARALTRLRGALERDSVPTTAQNEETR